MYTMKILNGNKCFIKFDIDFKNNNIKIIEKNNDLLLNAIFHGDFSYKRVISFIKSRIKNDVPNHDLVNIINETELKLFDDSIKMIIC